MRQEKKRKDDALRLSKSEKLKVNPSWAQASSYAVIDSSLSDLTSASALCLDRAYLAAISRGFRLGRKQHAHERLVRVLHQLLVLGHHKVLVLHKEVVSLVAHATSVMLNGKASLGQLWLGEALAAGDLWGAVQPIGKVHICGLHHNDQSGKGCCMGHKCSCCHDASEGIFARHAYRHGQLHCSCYRHASSTPGRNMPENSSVTADINGRKTSGVLHASALIQQVHNGWEVCHGGDSFAPVYLGDAKGGMTYLGKPALLIQ